MKSLSARIAEANSLLAPNAVRIDGGLGREHPEPEDETRFPFQRDRDRIIHAQAFRRLKGKTQVFVAGEGDHYRTRMTHTMEVTQLSRDIARTLSLNEDLAECIALAHDLGHSPFAHMGEEALNAWMKKQGSSFEHNNQSLRVVTTLEEHSHQYLGLNLNREVLDGLKKHAAQRSPKDPPPSLEAQLVNIADAIAYNAHDCDDGLRAELFTLEDLRTMPLIRSAYERCALRGTSLRGALIHLLVTDLYTASNNTTIQFSSGTQKALDDLQAFLHKHMYSHPRVRDANKQGQEIITTLCDRFFVDPPEKVLALQKRTGSGLPDAVKDYVAGMTDAFAKSQAQSLLP